MPPVELARDADIDAVLALRDRAAIWLQGRGIDQWEVGQLPRAVVERRFGANTLFVLRDCDDGLLATITVDFEDVHTWEQRGLDAEAGYIHTVIVAPEHAGEGIGVRLIEWAEARIVEHGCTTSRLDCAEGNPLLREWYRGLGYREVGRRDYGDVWFPVTLFERHLV